MSQLTTIGFDADDTLWYHERFFQLTQTEFAALLSDYADIETLEARVLAAEERNLEFYGFGVKGFVLSMIETAVDVTDGRVPGSVIRQLIDLGRDMLSHPIDLLPGVASVIEDVSRSRQVILITKGDLLDQERKLAQSGLGPLFDAVEILSHKTSGAYANIFARHGRGVAHGMMVGNALASDVVPMIEAGGFAVHVPGEHSWEVEHAPEPQSPRYRKISALTELPGVIASIES